MKISILGGTGKLGSGLAKRFAHAGKEVMIGSREKQRADDKATELNEELKNTNVKGESLVEAVKWGDIIFISVPYQAQSGTIEQIKDYVNEKVVVDATVPLGEDVTEQMDNVTSLAEKTVKLLGLDIKFVSGFHTISHSVLKNLEMEVESDVLMCGNNEEAVALISNLTREIGANPVHAGNIKNARVLERLTPMVIGMNKRYKKRHIGIKITGL